MMDLTDFLKLAPKAALFLLPLVGGLAALAIFNLFKKRKEAKETKVSTSPLSGGQQPSFQPPPTQKTTSRPPILLILTLLALILSLPLAVFLVKQKEEKQDIRMKAQEILSPTPSLSPPSDAGCQAIQIYLADPEWTLVKKEALSQLSPGQTVRIAIQGDPVTSDKARIRINQTPWTKENETTNQKPGSPGEFYIECQINTTGGKATLCGIEATEKDLFTIEGELHNQQTGQWH